MADEGGFDLHKRVLGSLPSAEFSWDDSESDVSDGFGPFILCFVAFEVAVIHSLN